MKKLRNKLIVLILCILASWGQAQNFVAPLGTNPDPNIAYSNGWYYYTGTSGNGVYLKKARTLEGLKHSTMTKVFSETNGGSCCNYWAPELHRINNTWYIYYTASDLTDLSQQRTWVIENTSADPMDGSWVNRGQLYDSSANYWAIDGTILETGGQYYFIWSGVAQPSDGDKPQRLYIARMVNPWTLEPGRVLLSSPDLSWEKNGAVNEGPSVLKGNDRIFLTYSANGCWTPDYLIGTLYMNEGADPMNPGSWTKYGTPLFTKFPARDVYAPGHHSFFKSPDGSETWFVYHATPNSQGACDNSRTSRAQKVFWNSNGFPVLGLPDPTGTWLTAPSGEPPLPAGGVLPNGIYKITPTSSAKPLDVAGCSPLPGVNVHQWEDNGFDCQKWHIIATPDGYYSINSVRGGLAMDVSDCSSSNAANVQMWNPSGADCQKWSFEQVSPGIFKIISKLSGKVLDIQFGSSENGANLQIYDYLQNTQQHFRVELLDSYAPTSWESHNFPGYVIRHQNGRCKIDKNVSPADDGRWRMVPGLAGQGVSFQSVNFPNSYLRHRNGEVWSWGNDGSQTFREDATFFIRAGLADPSKVSFESYNFPGNYLRHRNYLLYMEAISTEVGKNDATFSKISTAPIFSQKIEAESYTSQLGIQTEACSEGGLNVGWIDSGDWMAWDVNLPSSGTYTVEYNVASINSTGVLQLERVGGSPIYGTLSVPNTGGWQNWTTISHSVDLNAGVQQIAIKANIGGWNINWLNIHHESGMRMVIETVAPDHGLHLYPNPVEKFLYLPEDWEPAYISISNVQGQVIYEGSCQNQIDVSGLKPGMFILRSKNVAGEVSTGRFYKK